MVLKDRVAIITGSASGMGRAGALHFAKAGAKIVVVDINEQGGHETERLIRESGGEALFVLTDVSQPNQVEAMVKSAVEHYGRIDIHWNNAAATKLCNEQDRPVHLLPEAVWDRMIAVSLKGLYLCCKNVLPHMMKARKGVVINTSSTDALIGQGGYDSYTAAKGGIVSITRSMAVYYSSFGIRINAICPGFVHTELQDPWLNNPKSRRAIEDLHLTRVGKPEDIAKFALYLASDDAEYITGGIFNIDGGFTAFKTHVTDYTAEGST